MTRRPLALAALASAAVPGLDPSTVEGVVTAAAHPFDVAFVQDTDHRRWVIRCPRTPAASAQLEQSSALLAILARRFTLPVPAVKGWVALPEGGRAAVHSYLTGRPVDLSALTPGSRLAVGIGRGLAQLHNLDVAVYEEAGVPVYEAEGYRSRRLADLDRAAATGRVPTGLLTRWESILDDVARWRFTTVPTHGAIRGDTLLATPTSSTDEQSPESAAHAGTADEVELKAFLEWESAQVADPADDLAELVGALDEETLDTVLEAYAHARVQRPDAHLVERARLVHEMRLVRAMTAAVAAGDDAAAEAHAATLRRLDQEVARREQAEQDARERQERTERSTAATEALPRKGGEVPDEQPAGAEVASDEASSPDAHEEAVETERPLHDGDEPPQPSGSTAADRG